MPRTNSWISSCSARSRNLDANDLLYQVNASRDYDPSPGLEKIKAPLTAGQLGGRFHQPARTWHRGTRDQAREKRPLRAAAGLRSDPRARHAHLGRRLAAVPGAIAGRLEDRRNPRTSPARLLAGSVQRSAGLAASISLISALRSLASMAREWPRGNSRDRCTGPNRTRINRLTMMPRAAHQCRTCAERVARTVTLSQ